MKSRGIQIKSCSVHNGNIVNRLRDEQKKNGSIIVASAHVVWQIQESVQCVLNALVHIIWFLYCSQMPLDLCAAWISDEAHVQVKQNGSNDFRNAQAHIPHMVLYCSHATGLGSWPAVMFGFRSFSMCKCVWEIAILPFDKQCPCIRTGGRWMHERHFKGGCMKSILKVDAGEARSLI